MRRDLNYLAAVKWCEDLGCKDVVILEISFNKKQGGYKIMYKHGHGSYGPMIDGDFISADRFHKLMPDLLPENHLRIGVV